jgi:hypothetical protein
LAIKLIVISLATLMNFIPGLSTNRRDKKTSVLLSH